MDKPVKRLIYTIVTALVFLGIYTGAMFYIERQHYEKLIVMHNRSQTDSLRGILDRYERTETEIGNIFYEDLNEEVRLKAFSLAAEIKDGQYTGPRMWDDGMAVRIINGSLELPEGADGMFAGLSADTVQNEYTQQISVKTKGEEDPLEVILTGGRITGDWYYVLYKTEGLKEYGTIAELGITEEDLRKDFFELKSHSGNEYICTPAALESGRVFVCCDSVMEEKAAFIGDILTQILFAALLFIVLIVWCYYVTVMVATNQIKDDMIRNYTPEAVKRRTKRLGAMSVMLVYTVAFLTVAMQYMYQEDKVGSAALSLLEEQVEAESQTVPQMNRKDIERYSLLGREISELLTEHPDYMEKDRLAQLAEIVSADYLIVFDENGDEIGCSEDYTGFSLGRNEGDPSTDFRRLLRGIRSIIHEPEKDFITGENRQIVGVRYALPDKAGQYGAILISVPLKSEKENPDDLIGKRGFYKTMASTGEMILEIDPESQIVVDGSREEYIGSESAGLGIKKEALLDRHMGFFRINGQWYFGISRLVDGKICYYLADNTTMLLIGLMFALFTATVFLAGYWLTSKYALRGYTKENYEKYAQLILEAKKKGQERLDETTPEIDSSLEKWEALLPEQKTKRVFQVAMGLFMTLLLLVALSDAPISGHSVLNFVIEGNWTKGLNVFGIVAAIMVVSIEYLLFLIVKVYFLLLYGVMDAKGETVGRLIRSFINYILIAIMVFLTLNFLGVDTATLLASMGLLSLAISLGAKDIVADILSGIGLVFDGTASRVK